MRPMSPCWTARSARPAGYLGALLEAELDDRAERRRHRLIGEARLPRLKRLEDFAFEEAPQIPAARIRELATLAFVDKAEPVIFVGDSERSGHRSDVPATYLTPPD